MRTMNSIINTIRHDHHQTTTDASHVRCLICATQAVLRGAGCQARYVLIIDIDDGASVIASVS